MKNSKQKYPIFGVSVVFGLFLAFSGGSAFASSAVKTKVAPVAQVQEAKIPKPIAKMLADGRDVKILDSFRVEGTDLTAWIVVAEKERRIFYVPADGNVAILGLVFDENLNNVTTEHALAYSEGKKDAKRDIVPPRELGFESGPEVQLTLAQLATANASHVEGEGRDVYVIYDPACVHCHRVWHDTRKMLDRVRLHWIPIAKVSPHSAQLADSILGAVDAPAAFAAAANKRLAMSATVSHRTQSILKKNSSILEASGKKNVPYLTFTLDGKVYSYLGAPNEAALAVIGGDAVTPRNIEKKR